MDESLSVWFFAMFDENHSIHFKMIKDDNTVGAGIRSVHTKWIAYRPLQRILTNFTLFKGSLITILGNHYKFSRFTFPHTSMKCHFFGMVCHFFCTQISTPYFCILGFVFLSNIFSNKKAKSAVVSTPHLPNVAMKSNQISTTFRPTTENRFSNPKITYITSYFSIWSPKKRCVYLGHREFFRPYLICRPRHQILDRPKNVFFIALIYNYFVLPGVKLLFHSLI